MFLFTSRQEKIFYELLNSDHFVVGKVLAEKLSVTTRTVRNDIAKIEEHLSEIKSMELLSTRGKGYKIRIIEEDQVKEFLKKLEEKEVIPDEPVDRVNYILSELLFASSYIKIDDLSEGLFVSRSTVQNDLKDIRVLLNQFDLNLIHKSNRGIKVIGDEKQRRYAISEILIPRKLNLSVNMPQHFLLPDHDIKAIESIVLNCIKKQNINLSDLALNNLIIHIAIACQRIKKESYVDHVDEQPINELNEREYTVAKEIIKDLSKELDVSFPSVEVSYIAMHLLGAKVYFNKEERKQHTELEKQIHKVVQKMIRKVDREMNSTLYGDSELETVLSVHLKPVIHRYNYNMIIRNPMLEAIKTNYPIAFEAGVNASRVMEEEFSIQVDENEIGYIALHFGAAIERQKYNNKPLKCLIVCTTGLGSSKLLYYKLRSHFSDKISFVGTTELYNVHSYDENEVDFIVSTVPMPETINIPYILVDALLDNDSLNKVGQYIEWNNQPVMEKYLKKNMIFLQQDFSSVKEVIEFIGNQLIEHQYVSEGIIESTLKREGIASTSYGNFVAIPHPMEDFSKETFITFVTLKNKIEWGEKPVQLICFLHVAKNNYEDLEPMYNQLLTLIDDKEKVELLLNCHSTSEVLALLIKK